MVNMVNTAGKPVHGVDGKVIKMKVCMGNGTTADGTPQSFYFPMDVEKHAGLFKGMKVCTSCLTTLPSY